MSDSFRYYQLVDWIGNGAATALLIAAGVLIYREWRSSNRIAQQHAIASERHAAATIQLAQAIEHTAQNPAVENGAEGAGRPITDEG